jgi:SAM-dependent methyltransferase
VNRSSGPDADYLLDDLVAAESWHFWFRARRQLVIWALRAYFPQRRTMLDVGCGTGFLLDGLRTSSADTALAGCDLLFEGLRRARQRLDGMPVFQADVGRLPVRRPFDAITALDVIEHVDDDEAALRELFRGLTPGGGLVITVPQHQWLWSEVDEFSRHRRRYSRTDMLSKLRAAGFEVLRCTSFFATTLPLMAVRLFRPQGDAFDPAAELRIPRLWSAVAGAMLRPEWLLIRAGLSLPIGGSLLVVARRPLS